MYEALWSHLPGPVWVRIVICVILFVVVSYILLEWVFPAIGAMTTPDVAPSADVVVGGSTATLDGVGS